MAKTPIIDKKRTRLQRWEPLHDTAKHLQGMAKTPIIDKKRTILQRWEPLHDTAKHLRRALLEVCLA